MRDRLLPACCRAQGRLPPCRAAASPVRAGLGHFQGHSLSEGGERRLGSAGGRGGLGGFAVLIPPQILQNELLWVRPGCAEGKVRAGLGVGGGISQPLVSAVTSNCQLRTSNLNYFLLQVA